jgi:hypothetical protein
MNWIICFFRGHRYDSKYGIKPRYNLKSVRVWGELGLIQIPAGADLRCKCGKWSRFGN